MKSYLLLMLLSAVGWAQQAVPVRPRAGKPPILRSSEVKPGMKAVAWTVLGGTEPEAVPIEILGVMKNQWGPKQDIILGKMGGKAQRTNVAGGMSGSPVYVDGKLVGAVSLRLSMFSPDAICGITPIELMLEINDFDQSTPAEARVPGEAQTRAAINVPGSFAQVNGGSEFSLTPIDTPLVFSGFHESTLREFGPMLRQMGVSVAQGGAAGAASARLAPGWQNALQPGEALSGVLVSGDMSMSGMGTVTYNDGKRVLAFGHPFLSLGPVAMPMAKSEIVWTLASAFQPFKIGNATGVVGSLRQDRHSGIMGVLGEQAPMIPCRLRVRSFDGAGAVRKEKNLRFDVFVQQRWTPFLMMVTLFNGISSLNEFSDDATYRISGTVDTEDSGKISLHNMFAPSEMPTPTPVPIMMAFWYGDKFNKLFFNPVRNPRLKSVDVTLDLLPERRMAAIESAYADTSEVDAGGEVPLRVYLRPYRGGRIERQIKVRIPAAFPKGDHRILLSDAETLNRMQTIGGFMNRFIDLPQAISLINQERTNDKLYVSLVQARPTVYQDDKMLPSLPASVANVMQNGRSTNRSYFTTPESADQQMALPFDLQVTGSYSLRIKVN
jgi:hypothetical protein